MYHQVVLAGTVGKDCEMRYTPSGQPVATFSVAVDDKRGDKKNTLWFRVTVWNKTAEVCNEHVRKGMKVLVEGQLQYDTATGGPRTFKRNNGDTGTSFEVNGDKVRFLTFVEAKETVTEEAPAPVSDEVPF
jgi:single-strand DNA-binding protein